MAILFPRKFKISAEKMLIGSCFQTIFLLKWLLFSGDIRSFFFFLGGGVVSFLFVSPKDWVISGRGSQATMMGEIHGWQSVL